MSNEEQTIELPILVFGVTVLDYRRFREQSGFAPHELKHILTPEDIHGCKDRILFVLGWQEGLNDVLAYAKQHNIRIVKS